MSNSCRTFLSAAVLVLFLGSCGGGGIGSLASSIPGGGGGIGGTGVTSSGPVSGFGSVFVNGVEFATDNADITVNGVQVGEDALGLGMVVLVRGTVNADGVTGSATSIEFESALRGPPSSIARRPDGDIQLLVILGVEVIAQRGVTVFEQVEFDALTVSDLLDISGYVSDNGRLIATRINRLGAFVPAASEIDRIGIVANLSGTQFSLGDLLVDFSAADLSGLPGGTVTDADRVVVHGTLSGGVIAASKIRPPADVSGTLQRDEEIVVQGAITDFSGPGGFVVGSVPVDASEAVLELSGETLGNGLIVQIAGAWDGEKLVARSVVSRQGRILVAGTVASADARDDRISLQLYGTNLSFLVNSQTLVADNTRQQDRLTLAGISSGEFVIVEALVRGETRLALRITRSAERSNVLSAPVERFEAGRDITLQDITVNTMGAAFIDRQGQVVSADAFFAQLRQGDLVRVTDELRADGQADEVRLLDF